MDLGISSVPGRGERQVMTEDKEANLPGLATWTKKERRDKNQNSHLGNLREQK